MSDRDSIVRALLRVEAWASIRMDSHGDGTFVLGGPAEDAPALFDHPVEPRPEPAPALSPDRRRTLRQSEHIAAGVHPLLVTLGIPRARLHPQAPADASGDAPRGRPFTCGTCVHRGNQGGTAGSYAKCWFGDGVRASRGPATDVRAWWPACLDYEAKDGAA